MSVISLNILLNRDSHSAREFWDSWDEEPILITRDGDAYALIHRVARDDHAIMSALPEFIESRKRAENARAEGRTVTLKELKRRWRREKWRRLLLRSS